MKRFVMVVTLACALSGTALAGNIPTSGAPSPGNIPTGGAPSPAPSGTQSSAVVTVILAIISIVAK